MKRETLERLKEKFDERARKYSMAEYCSMEDLSKAHRLHYFYTELSEDIQEILDETPE